MSIMQHIKNSSQKIFYKKINLIAVALISLPLTLSASPASAQMELVHQTPENWFIYKEQKSCVAYVDFETGTTLRFSNRTDENRVYFLAYNKRWEGLRAREGESVQLTLEFPELEVSHHTTGVVIDNSGTMGLTGGDLANMSVLLALAGSTSMILHVSPTNAPKRQVVETFQYQGAGKAAVKLESCSDRFFN